MLWWTLRQLRSGNAVERKRAAKKLGDTREKRAVDALVQALRDESGEVQAEAALALGRIGDERGGRHLITMLEHEDSYASRDSARALDALGLEPDDAHRRVLKYAALNRWQEIESIGSDAADTLSHLISKDKGTSPKMLTILARIDAPRAIQPLEKMLNRLAKTPGRDIDYDGWSEVIKALGESRDPRTVGVLIELASFTESKFHDTAIEALRKIGSEAVDPLITCLERDKNTRDAAEALAKIGDARAVDALIKALNHEREHVRAAVAKTLELFAGKRQDVKDLLEKYQEQEQLRKSQEQTRKVQEVIELRRKIQAGMKLDEVIAILGPPSSQFGGDAVLGVFGNVSGSASAISSVSQRQYYVWRRPEGEWQLVFVGNKLDNIHSRPPLPRP